MENHTESLHAASRLIYLSLIHSSGSRRAMAPFASEMAELLQRFQSQESFRQMVETGLKAMELRLLALEDKGLRLSARRSDSFFAATLTDYGKLLARSDLKAAEILPVHCAIATAFFPTEADLDAPVEDLGAIVIVDVMDILKRFALAELALPDGETRLHPQVKSVAERLRLLPEDNPDRQRAGSGTSWVELITIVLDHMVETGYLLAFEETPGEVEYRPTPAYQTALREGIVYAFHAFRDIVKAASLEEKNTAGSAAGEGESHV
ncbi:hypothetical protein LZ24_01235 [Desulfobotulus alkaliphilus]|uniref:Uncharacterized protein n=1 Tax=Desulfobotulus alkaliphilus TaxID=622671 RepID=A0A562RY75_9BACT|nr:hypothetical protein [Desulfobotulus alkaliphilus]TWI74005.1 hypothetical protein LZ24_01235 [Desulfobotulus alkaliphilus]